MKKNFLLLFIIVFAFVATRSLAQGTLNEPLEIKSPESRVEPLPVHPEIVGHIENVESNLIGTQAPELIMKDRFRNTIALSSVRTPYILVVFWDAGCGHCRIQIPKLDSLYKKYLKKKGCEVISVNLDANPEEWLNYVDDHHLEWINVSDPLRESNFRVEYNVYSTPTIYILDKNRNIVAKTVGTENVKDILDGIIKTDKKNKNVAGSNEVRNTGENLIAENNLSSSPNPFTDGFTLYLPVISDKVSVSVFSVDGKIQFSADYNTVNSTLYVDVKDKNLTPGFYLVTVRTNRQTYSRKLIKG